MSLNDSEKLKRKLQDEYNRNVVKISELHEKIKIIKANSWDAKVTRAFSFSMFPWVLTIALMPVMIKLNIPLNIIQPSCVGVSILIGIIGEEVYTRKSKYREKLREFSESKTQRERIEEATKYEIEQEKLRSINKVLGKDCDYLSENYNKIKEYVDESTLEEISDNMDSINTVLQKKQLEANIMTTKNVLIEKFWRVIDKFYRFADILSAGLIGVFTFMAFCNMPIIGLNLLENMGLQTSLFSLLAPALIGGLAGSCYCFKKEKDHEFVFKNMNDQLGHDAISSLSEYEDNKDLESITKEIALIHLKLELEKQKLDYIAKTSSESETVSKTVEMDYSEKETTIDDVISQKEDNINEDQPLEQGFVLKKTMNKRIL